VAAAEAALVAPATVVAFIHLAAFAVLVPAAVCPVVSGLAAFVVLCAVVGWELEFPEFPALPEEPSAWLEEPSAGVDVCCAVCGGLAGAACGGLVGAVAAAGAGDAGGGDGGDGGGGDGVGADVAASSKAANGCASLSSSCVNVWICVG
jgi:hypothetical protein